MQLHTSFDRSKSSSHPSNSRYFSIRTSSFIDGDNVIEACQYLLKEKEAGQTNVIIGGELTGVEIAYDLVNHGKKVAILEMKDTILEGKFLSEANSNMLRQIIKDYDIPVYTGASVKLINENGVEFEYQGETRVVAADTVITATGYISQVTILDGLKDLPGVHIIGDANKVGNSFSSYAEPGKNFCG